ncbi:MipA/OmpV family protein [Burkholderia alba]|uniref:MipA/OmpV family protein n=1 Tax=Burkholderia alba TaxID=2683677 RepID=UPI00389959E9
MTWLDLPRCLLLCAACGAFTHALADEPAAGAMPGDASKWKISIGPGLMYSPKYPGSRDLRLLPLPSLDISYDDRIFSQGLDVLGVNLLKGSNYHFGTAISFDFQSRKASDDPHLHGLGNVNEGPKLKVFADYSVSLLTGSLAAYQDIAGTGQGLLVSADLAANLPVTQRLLISVGPGVTWANATYMHTLFGVNAKQSAASGLPAYDTGSGIRDLHLNTYVSYDFTRHWTGSVALTLGRLQRVAADSPITERKTELNLFSAVNYRF